MWIPVEFLSKNSGILSKEDYEDTLDHAEFTERLRRTLYYGDKMPDTDRPSLPLTDIAVEFFQEAAPRGLGKVDRFSAANISRKACMSPCSLMLGMIYIERLKHRNPEYLQKVSSSDIFLISMMMASKFLYDEGVDEEVFNDEWAESAKMDIDEINELERSFLAAIDWNLFVSATDFWKTLNNLEQRIAGTKAKERGFYTYSDLSVLAEDLRFYEVFRKLMLEMCKVMMVCSFAYVAGALTMVGSVATLVYLRHHIPPRTIPVEQVAVPVPGEHFDMVTSAVVLGAETESHVNESRLQSAVMGLVKDVTKKGKLDSSPPESMNETSTPPSQRKKHLPNRHKHKSMDAARDMEHLLDNQPQLYLPGLMTLVMLKDTMVQFASAVRDRYSQSWFIPGVDADQADADLICTEGFCTADHGNGCQNRTLSGFRNLRRCATERQRSLGQIRQQGLNSKDQGVKCQTCQCCCPVSTDVQSWQPVTLSTVMRPLHDIIPGHRTTAAVVS